jgi:hypothetical protein
MIETILVTLGLIVLIYGCVYLLKIVRKHNLSQDISIIENDAKTAATNVIETAKEDIK